MSSTNKGQEQREQRLLEKLTNDLLLGALHFLTRAELCTLELVNRRMCSLISMPSTQNILGQMHVVFDVEVNHYPAYAPISHQTSVMCDGMGPGAKWGPIKPVPTRAVPWLRWKGLYIWDYRLIDAEVEAFLLEFSQQVASSPCCILYRPTNIKEDKASDELRKALGLITGCCHISIYGNPCLSESPEARTFFEGMQDSVVTWLHTPSTRTERKRHVYIMDVLDNDFVQTLHATLLQVRVGVRELVGAYRQWVQQLRTATTRCPSYLLKAFGVRGREFAIAEAAETLRCEEFNEQTGESLLLQATYCDDLLDRRSFTYCWTRDIQK